MREPRPFLYPLLRGAAVGALVALLYSVALADATAPPTTVTPADPAWEALQAVYAYDNTLPTDPVIVEQTQSAQMVTRRLTLAAHDGERIPATMHLPLGDGPFPCVLLLHGYGGNADDYSTVAAALLVPRGIAVMAIDARLHGRRAQEGVEMWSADLERSRQATINTVIDNRRALDYLDTLDCIDHSRYMALGLSMGAIMGAVLGLGTKWTVRNSLGRDLTSEENRALLAELERSKDIELMNQDVTLIQLKRKFFTNPGQIAFFLRGTQQTDITISLANDEVVDDLRKLFTEHFSRVLKVVN